jgi:hypothetical protein
MDEDQGPVWVTRDQVVAALQGEHEPAVTWFLGDLFGPLETRIPWERVVRRAFSAATSRRFQDTLLGDQAQV